MADEKTRLFILTFLLSFCYVQCEVPQTPLTQPQCNKTKILNLLDIFVTTKVSEIRSQLGSEMKLVMEALARLEEKIAELTGNQEPTLKDQSNSSEISNSSRLVELQLKTQDTEDADMDG